MGNADGPRRTSRWGPLRVKDQDGAFHPGRQMRPALAIIHNACTVHASLANASLVRASLNIIQLETNMGHPPADEGVLTASRRPFRWQAGSGRAAGLRCWTSDQPRSQNAPKLGLT
jgi:hypothetical protein